jgi:HK97 gp10 family phage protein
MASIDLEVRGLRELIDKLEGFPSWNREAARDALSTVGREMERTARSLVPVRRGDLRESIFSRVTGMVLHFGAAKRYARYVEEGTRPHEIRPVRARALRFVVTPRSQAITRRGRMVTVFRYRGRFTRRGPRAVFARRVWHPGTWARPFIGPAVTIGLDRAPELIREKLRRWWNR